MKSRSTEEHPFAFFDWYLETEIYSDLKEFYRDMTEELYFSVVDEIDRENHIIKIPNIHHQDVSDSKYITFSFKGRLKSKLKNEIKKTKEFIKSGFEKRFANKNEIIAYARFLNIKIKTSMRNNLILNSIILKKYLNNLLVLLIHFLKK